MERIRAFIALNLPVAVIDKVAKLQTRLSEAAEAAGMRVAWVPVPNLHVTLKFLGEIPAESAHAIGDVLTERLAGRKAWDLTVKGVGVFPDVKSSRVLWVGVHEEGEQLQRVIAQLEEGLETLGFPRDKRPFHPHLTLGRIKQGATDIWSPLADEEVADSCQPTDIVLYRSKLQRQGAEYTALTRVALQSAKTRKRRASVGTQQQDA